MKNPTQPDITQGPVGSGQVRIRPTQVELVDTILVALGADPRIQQSGLEHHLQFPSTWLSASKANISWLANYKFIPASL